MCFTNRKAVVVFVIIKIIFSFPNSKNIKFYCNLSKSSKVINTPRNTPHYPAYKHIWLLQLKQTKILQFLYREKVTVIGTCAYVKQSL